MKSNIIKFFKETFIYTKKHSTNFLLGIIIFILLFMWCNSSLGQKEWFIVAKYKIFHPGYKYKSEIVGKVKYVCSEFDQIAFLEKSRVDNIAKSSRTLEEIQQFRKGNESQFYRDVERDSNVVRDRKWKFFIFKTYDEITFSQKMGENCKCNEIDPLTNNCKWTEFANPTPTAYLLNK